MHRWGNKKDMAGDDPPYLSVGTEVSAKYKGAFCEAKIRKVVKTVKCKVQYKNEQGSSVVTEDQIKGVLMSGASVEVKLPDKKETIEGVIVKIQDLSQYTVVFDDGDIATLRRTALCLKSGRHFAESETLDQLPLTHPEHFSTPVVSGVRGSRRRDDMDENSDDEEKREPKVVEREEDMGKVVCVEIGDKKKTKDNWFPGLIVAPNAQDSVKIDVEDEYLVRSFKDGRYYTVPKTEANEFTREIGAKVDNPTLKQAVEKAISFLDKSDLPPHWDRDQLFGMTDFVSDIEASDTDSTDDEPREEKDHFVAQLYKFMDDRGTPINRGPVISSRDVDLYKLFKIVYKLGGYNRVTNRNQWKSVTLKMGYSANQTNNVKSSYKKFLHSFEDFYRKLGCTLLTTSTDNKLRSRSSRPLIRDRDRAPIEKITDKDENSSSNNLGKDDNVDAKEQRQPNPHKAEPRAQKNADDDEDVDGVEEDSADDDDDDDDDGDDQNDENDGDDDHHLEQQHSSKRPPADSCEANLENGGKEDENLKLKKRFDIPLVKHYGAGGGAAAKDRDEKKGGERKATGAEKKAGDKASLKMTKAKRLKGVEKKAGKMQATEEYQRTKRSLKEKVKDMVHKLKGAATPHSAEGDRKKRLTAEELSKMSQFGVKVKSKDELLNNGLKTRKLSVGGASDKSTSNASVSGDKKSNGSTTQPAASAVDSSGSRPKRSDDDGSDSYKRKSVSRKRKDDEKISNSSVDLLINQAIDFVPHYKSICIGDRLRVYYEPTHESKVTYEAKVTNKRYGTATEYLVHYTGWNTRYDEWIRRSRIADNLSWSPTRTKKKGQLEPLPSDNTPIHQSEPPPQSQQNVNGAKTPTEKPKRSSMSPVSKSFATNSIKSGLKKIRKVRKQFKSKTKKSTIKDTDSSSETDSESGKKPELQKTRSRTEKQKQQDTDPPPLKESAKESLPKKKTPFLKRTRSGSSKSENNEPPKKRKYTKSNKGTSVAGNIRHTIKAFVSRKRSNRIRDLSKDSKPPSSDLPSNDESADVVDAGVSSDRETDEPEAVPSRKVTSESVSATKAKVVEEPADGDPDEMLLILDVPPLNAEKVLKLEADSSFLEQNSRVGTDSDASSVNVSPPVLKKEVLTFEEMNNFRIGLNQSLATSYLAENIEAKPKMVKSGGAKPKKDGDEAKQSPSKLFSRSPNDKLAAKTAAAGDGKEKTFFPSRAATPTSEKGEKNAGAAKKFDPCDAKDKKETKIRSVTTLNSYLAMDKIDSIKKVATTPEKSSPDKSEKPSAPSPAAKQMAEFPALSSADDVYEFKEPEPLEFRGIDDRNILHRRPAARIFEDGNAKRPKTSPTASDTVIRESDDGKCCEEISLEIKPILQSTSKEDVKAIVGDLVKCEKVIVETSRSDESCGIVLKVESKELVAKSSGEVAEIAYAQPLQIVTETVVDAIDEETLQLAESLSVAPLIESLEEDDAEGAKLVILEGSVADASAILTDEFVETVTSSTAIVSDVQEAVANSSKKKLSTRLVVVGSDDKEMPFTEFVETAEAVAVHSGAENSGDSNVVADVEKYRITSSPPTSCQDLFAKASTAVPDSTASSPLPESKSKTYVKSEESSNEEDAEDESSTFDEGSSNNFIQRVDGIINEVEIEAEHAAGGDIKSDKNHLGWEDEKVPNSTNVYVKTKSRCGDDNDNDNNDDDDDDDMSNDLLLCEETIPKSPESKEPAASEGSVSYARGSRLTSSDSGKSPMRETSTTKPKKKGRSSNYSAPSDSVVFENTPPTTPEEGGSTPATSPSEGNGGFSSPAFSLHEKSCSNKENERSSDNSEKPTKSKKFSEDDSYQKKDYDSYVKKKEKDLGYKSDEPPKKRLKSVANSLNGSERDDFSDGGNSPKASTSSSKSSVAALLAECPPDLDSNQRIEYLEQKLHTIRKAYNTFKQEVASIDKRRKKLRRKEREGRMMTRNEANSLL